MQEPKVICSKPLVQRKFYGPFVRWNKESWRLRPEGVSQKLSIRENRELHDDLTARERDILALLTKGYENQQIADELHSFIKDGPRRTCPNQKLVSDHCPSSSLAPSNITWSLRKIFSQKTCYNRQHTEWNNMDANTLQSGKDKNSIFDIDDTLQMLRQAMFQLWSPECFLSTRKKEFTQPLVVRGFWSARRN